ncbi:hypothetical protein CcaCcLH18_04510 [Colletotrichum camelliae]|nr:hypothetical protein CcaCcLH18_04510 [Colletotrichum camelliae]
MEQIRPSNGPRASLDRDGDDDESRPQSSLLPATGGHIRQQKQNFWLRRTVLMAFSFLFIACALALIGVSRHITAQNGLPLSLSSSSYSWTYGPTGVLVLILALWRQVDYNCRSMQPWWEMAQGPSTAARSVLLDYVSPFQPMACFSALKNGHYAVFISILSFLVLKLIILLSTTLFVVEPTWHLEPVSFRYQNAFNTEYMWNSPGDNSATPMGDIGDRSRQGDVTVWSYMATLNNATAGNLGGTKSRNMAYQSLIPPQFSSNISSISTVVDVFVPSVTCEEASLSLPTTTFGNSEYELYYRFDSPSCSPSDMQLQDNFLICKVSYSRYYDVVFNHIVFGPRKTLPTDMLGPSNIDALTEAITHSFKEYLAHVIDLNFRSNNSETSIQGTSLQTTTRLAMHKVSKIILQALLVATTVLSFVGYCLVKIRGTLPRNPCSIASTMGFLADSQLCDPKTGILPKDASLMTERELRQSLHGFVFSLGWWERSRDSEASRPTSPSGEESSDLDAGDQQEVSESTYFGIDVGHTNALGFSKKEK